MGTPVDAGALSVEGEQASYGQSIWIPITISSMCSQVAIIPTSLLCKSSV
jgi:hypothetical protein